MQLALTLNTASDQPLHTQIFDQIRGIILSGKLRADMALPPSRALAEELSVSRNTVLLAYERLIAEGYIESRGTAGTFVSSHVPDDLLRISGSGDSLPEPEPCDEPEPVLCFAGLPGGDGDGSRPRIDFWVGRSAPESFPLRTWRKLLIQNIEKADVNLTDYSDPAGLPELRQSLAEHLARSRGMTVEPDQVVVTGGSQDGLNLVHRLLADRYQTFFVEDPCYQGAALLFQGLGRKVCPISVDQDGMCVDQLPPTDSSVVFVTPSHQFPTGATLPLERRLQLLNWAEETGSLIIEDDYDSDFRYTGPPLTALAGLDNCKHVFYLGTFSKSLGAGLRLGYTVVPKSFASRTRVTKAHMNNGQPWLDQMVLSQFLDSGEFDRHLRRVRKIYKARRDCLLDCLTDTFPETIVKGSDSGLHLVWQLPKSFPPATEIQTRARALGVGIYSLKSGAAVDMSGQAGDNLLLLGYSSVQENDICEAVTTLRRLIDKMRGETKSHVEQTDSSISSQPQL